MNPERLLQRQTPKTKSQSIECHETSRAILLNYGPFFASELVAHIYPR
jgi:hypothetical protein